MLKDAYDWRAMYRHYRNHLWASDPESWGYAEAENALSIALDLFLDATELNKP